MYQVNSVISHTLHCW